MQMTFCVMAIAVREPYLRCVNPPCPSELPRAEESLKLMIEKATTRRGHELLS